MGRVKTMCMGAMSVPRKNPCPTQKGSVFYRFSGTIYDVITFLICIIQKREYL